VSVMIDLQRLCVLRGHQIYTVTTAGQPTASPLPVTQTSQLNNIPHSKDQQPVMWPNSELDMKECCA